MSLNPRRVELIRASGKTDRYWARIWRMTPSAIRHARTGTTWPDHPTPPDCRPRMPGRRNHVALGPELEPTVSLARLIARMPAPIHFNGPAEPR